MSVSAVDMLPEDTSGAPTTGAGTPAGYVTACNPMYSDLKFKMSAAYSTFSLPIGQGATLMPLVRFSFERAPAGYTGSPPSGLEFTTENGFAGDAWHSIAGMDGSPPSFSETVPARKCTAYRVRMALVDSTPSTHMGAGCSWKLTGTATSATNPGWGE